MQHLKQQLKNQEQTSYQQLAVQPDVDTKMHILTGLGHDRQQLPTAMAGVN